MRNMLQAFTEQKNFAFISEWF